MLTPFVLLTGWIFAILEGTILYPLRFWGAGPDLILVATAFYAVKNGVTIGAWSGFCLGLMKDLFSGMPFGFHLLVYTATGACSGLTARLFYWRNWSAYSLAVLIAGVFLAVLSIAIGLPLFARLGRTFTPLTLWGWAWMSLLNAILAPFIFPLFELWERFRHLTRDHVMRFLGLQPPPSPRRLTGKGTRRRGILDRPR